MRMAKNRVFEKVLPLAAAIALLLISYTYALNRPAPPDSIAFVVYSDDGQQAK